MNCTPDFFDSFIKPGPSQFAFCKGKSAVNQGADWSDTPAMLHVIRYAQLGVASNRDVNNPANWTRNAGATSTDYRGA